MKHLTLNFRDLGGVKTQQGRLPKGMFFRCGKLSVLSREECARLLECYKIRCVIDLRTPTEAAEFPDPLPDDVEYMQISLLKDATIGISHETGSDPMTIIKGLRKKPERLKEMIPDFGALYKQIVTEEYSKVQLKKVLAALQTNEAEGKPTLFHCTAGKDRTGIVSMALLKEKGVEEDAIISDFLRTNRSAFLPTVKKCIGIWLLTHKWELVRTAYKCFMADARMIQIAMDNYK